MENELEKRMGTITPMAAPIAPDPDAETRRKENERLRPAPDILNDMYITAFGALADAVDGVDAIRAHLVKVMKNLDETYSSVGDVLLFEQWQKQQADK